MSNLPMIIERYQIKKKAYRSNYDLASNESYQQFESAINGIVTAGGTVTGDIYEGCRNSRSTFRITNSKGQLDFRIYKNG